MPAYLLSKTQNKTNDTELERHERIVDENLEIGFLLGSKSLVQVIFNVVFMGPITNKIGFSIPMFFGFLIVIGSTLMFGIGTSLIALWIARAIQGIGSSCIATSGMGMLAQKYQDDAERGKVMGIALGGIALGVILGYPFGGLLYSWKGKSLPYFILAGLAALDLGLQCVIMPPKLDKGKKKDVGVLKLLQDPYVLGIISAITVANLFFAVLQAALPLWMIDQWNASSLETGVVFVPETIGYLFSTYLFGKFGHRLGRWLCGLIGLLVMGPALMLVHFPRNLFVLLIPNAFIGFALGMIDASMFPLMGYVVDIRHVGVYGSIYALADGAACIGFFVGPFISGPLVKFLGFPVMMYILGGIGILCAPLMLFLRKIPAKNNLQQQK